MSSTPDSEQADQGTIEYRGKPPRNGDVEGDWWMFLFALSSMIACIFSMYYYLRYSLLDWST